MDSLKDFFDKEGNFSLDIAEKKGYIIYEFSQPIKQDIYEVILAKTFPYASGSPTYLSLTEGVWWADEGWKIDIEATKNNFIYPERYVIAWKPNEFLQVDCSWKEK